MFHSRSSPKLSVGDALLSPTTVEPPSAAPYLPQQHAESCPGPATVPAAARDGGKVRTAMGSALAADGPVGA